MTARVQSSYRCNRRNAARKAKTLRLWRKFGQIRTKEGALFIAAPTEKTE